MTALLEGRVAVITGAGRGVGRASALDMAANGAKVVVNDLGVMGDGSPTDRTPALDVADEIRAAGGDAVANSDSVADFEGAGRIIQTAIDAFGRVDILAMFAGIVRGSSLLDTDDRAWDGVLDTHVRGHIACIHHASVYMKRQQSGRILCVTSGQGHIRVQPGIIPYGTAKRGVLGLMKAAALELSGYGIVVNAFSPLALTRLVTGGESDPSEDATAQQQAELLRHMYPPRFIAPAVTFLVSDAMPPVAGRLFYMNGPELSMIDSPRPVEVIHKRGRWTVEELAEAVPKYLAAAMDSGRTTGGSGPKIPLPEQR